MGLSDGITSLQLQSRRGQWSYTTFSQKGSASHAVWLSGGQNAAQALNEFLWEIAGKREKIDSNP